MRLAQAFVAFAFLSASGAALAQTPKLPPSVKLVTPPAMQKAVPALTAAQLDLDAAGKVALAGRWGLTITRTNLRPSFWVTPQAAAHANGATLSVLSTADVAISFGATAVFPYGNVPMRSSTTGSDTITVSNVPATPRDWFLVECLVTGGNMYGMSAKPTPPPSGGTPAAWVASNMYRELASDSRPRVSALFAPTTEARRSFEVHRFGPDFGDWRWGGCEVTPIQL